MTRRQRRRKHDRRRRTTGASDASRRLALGASLTAGAVLGSGGVAQADDTITVTNENPMGAGSLRDAIDQANADADHDLIVFQSSVTGQIALGGTQLSVTEPLTVQGPGTDSSLNVSGGDASRLFSITTGDDELVTISDLILTDGNVNGPNNDGGGILVNSGDLTLNRVEVYGYSFQSQALGTGSDGGGIAADDPDTTVTVSESEVSGYASGNGGAIFSANGSLAVRDSTIAGAGVADGHGGGIDSESGSLTIEDSTVFDNETYNVTGEGGGVRVIDGTATITGSTFSDNSASAGAGGNLFMDGASSSVTLTSSIFWNGDVSRADGTLNATANLFQAAPGGGINGTDTGNIVGQDPQLGSLDPNGGPTRTLAIPATSPAIDQGLGTGADQRGVNRTIDDPGVANSTVAGANGTDIGAFELQSAGDQTVTNLADTGAGSLRAAVIASNDFPSANTVTFQSGLTGSIPVIRGELSIEAPVDIEGPGADELTVDGGNAHRIFESEPGYGLDVTIAGLTLANGSAFVGRAGAVLQSGGNLTLQSLEATGSYAYNPGGAIATLLGVGDLTIESSTLSGNQADGAGAILFVGDELTVRSSTISGNSGGIYSGGGIYATGTGPATITDSTITGNDAGKGGGVYVYMGSQGPTFTNSLLADNTATVGPDLYADNPATDPTATFSLFEDPGASGQLGGSTSSDVFGVDPQLGALALNGGTTRTQALPQSSPAVDQGMSSTADQRGVARPVDFASIPDSMALGANGADIGAFELELPAPTPPPGTGTAPPGTTPTPPASRKKKCKKKKQKGKASSRIVAAAKKCKKKPKNR